MTRKDYILLAAALRAALNTDLTSFERSGVAVAAKHVASALGKDNARFERHRFLVACGVVLEEPVS